MRVLKEFLLSEKELPKFVKYLRYLAKDDGIFILRGDLASGKTSLVKAFCKELKIGDVSSPTFSVLNIYKDMVYHYDIYNKGVKDFISLGFLETLENEGFHFIEWGDEKLEKILRDYGFEYFLIEIEPRGDKRLYRIKHA